MTFRLQKFMSVSMDYSDWYFIFHWRSLDYWFFLFHFTPHSDSLEKQIKIQGKYLQKMRIFSSCVGRITSGEHHWLLKLKFQFILKAAFIIWKASIQVNGGWTQAIMYISEEEIICSSIDWVTLVQNHFTVHFSQNCLAVSLWWVILNLIFSKIINSKEIAKMLSLFQHWELEFKDFPYLNMELINKQINIVEPSHLN